MIGKNVLNWMTTYWLSGSGVTIAVVFYGALLTDCIPILLVMSAINSYNKMQTENYDYEAIDAKSEESSESTSSEDDSSVTV